eukprot:3494262-Rhodomonas_salina.2
MPRVVASAVASAGPPYSLKPPLPSRTSDSAHQAARSQTRAREKLTARLWAGARRASARGGGRKTMRVGTRRPQERRQSSTVG